uniref:Uncharacterized protein n=1 Tax=Siphoviridae sp. ctuy39 TaxID=2825719 RepID=A0A8S5VEG4_9CAUD|nr:MAG TPA: hypothetical protein [Siphoviridae sp. ctuy39]
MLVSYINSIGEIEVNDNRNREAIEYDTREI